MSEGRRGVRTQTVPVGESMTKQEFAQDTDVNFIVRKFQTTGVLTHTSKAKPIYADVSTQSSLHAAMNEMRMAEEGFAALPSEIRDAARNDPAVLLEMLATEDGQAVLVEAGMELQLGLPDSEEAPVEPEPVTPIASEEAPG